MKLVKIALGLVVLLVAAVLGGALLIDPAYAVSRSVQVQASPERVYALIDSSAGWARWGVWYRRDPQMKVTETGATRGAGAETAHPLRKAPSRNRLRMKDTFIDESDRAVTFLVRCHL